MWATWLPPKCSTDISRNRGATIKASRKQLTTKFYGKWLVVNIRSMTKKKIVFKTNFLPKISEFIIEMIGTGHHIIDHNFLISQPYFTTHN